MPSRKKNQRLMSLIQELKVSSHKNEAPIWKDIAKRLEKPSRNWAEVNINKISRFAKNDEMIIVPGKLLGLGTIAKPVVVASFKASQTAKKKLESAGGSSITIEEMLKKNPSGKGVRILG